MNRNILFILAIVIIVTSLFLAFNLQKTDEKIKDTNSVLVSKDQNQILDFELENFDGEKIRLADFKGMPVFLDFWAAWCIFCREEMPAIEKIHQEFGDKLIVLGIHRTDTESLEIGVKFAKERGVSYLLLKDSNGELYKAVGGNLRVMPIAAYINRDGEIVEVKAGPKTEAEMREKIKQVLFQ